MTLSPIDKQAFLKQLKKAEEYGDFSEKAVSEFYDWMYSHQDGYVQVCAFPVPTEDGWDIEVTVKLRKSSLTSATSTQVCGGIRCTLA